MRSARRPISTPVTYLITPGTLTPENYKTRSRELLSRIDKVARAGVSAVQLREKNLTSRLLFDLVKRLKNLLRESNTLCLLNERFDIAMAAGADGVHLTSTSIPVAAVRELVPENFIIGVSTHTIEEVVAATNASADMAVFGPVFDKPGKTRLVVGDGLAEVQRAARASGDMLLLGLGGVEKANFQMVLEAGADGVSGISMFADPDSARYVIDSIATRDLDAKA